MSPRPAPRFNSRFNLLGQSSFFSWPIWSVNAIPESLFWCSGSQNFSQYLMALHFVFVRIGKRPTSDLHAFELQNSPNSHLMNFVCTNSIWSFSSQAQCNLFVRGHHQDQRKRPLNDQQLWQWQNSLKTVKPGFHMIVRIVPIVPVASKNVQTIGTIIWKRYPDDRKRPRRLRRPRSLG